MSSQTSMNGEIKEQRQKTKDMSTKGKFEYFWYYYKVHAIVTVIAVIFVAALIRQYVTSKDYAFYAALINANTAYIENNQWSDEFAEYAEIDTEQYLVYIDPTFTISDRDSSQYSASNTEKLIAMLRSGDIDILVADTEIFENYAQNEFFMNLETVLPEDVLEKYQNNLYYTDAATYDNADDDAYYYDIDEWVNPDTFVINHHDPSTMEQPVPVGIFLPEGSKIMETGCYNHLKENNIVYQSYPSEAILGIPVTSTKLDVILQFLTFIEE